jgi:hypothetical protein
MCTFLSGPDEQYDRVTVRDHLGTVMKVRSDTVV